MMRILIDTDVTLDFILQRQLFFAEASEILRDSGMENLKPTFPPLRRLMSFISRAKQTV